MTKQPLPQKLSVLLLIGAIQGDVILELHQKLKAYQNGYLSVKDMQNEIDKYNPEHWQDLFDESFPQQFE